MLHAPWSRRLSGPHCAWPEHISCAGRKSSRSRSCVSHDRGHTPTDAVRHSGCQWACASARAVSERETEWERVRRETVSSCDFYTYRMLMHVRVQRQNGVHLILIVTVYILEYGIARQFDLNGRERKRKGGGWIPLQVPISACKFSLGPFQRPPPAWLANASGPRCGWNARQQIYAHKSKDWKLSESRLTWLRPKCTDAVSEMYMILPSGATTKMKPSSVCSRCEPSSLMVAPRCIAGEEPQASPRPAKVGKYYKFCWNKTKKNYLNCVLIVIRIQEF